MFQFHTGSIKRIATFTEDVYLGLSFNSILVRLKAVLVLECKHHENVSIPYWFD